MARTAIRGGRGDTETLAFDAAIEAMLVFYAEDVVCHPAPGWAPEDTVYLGHDGVRNLAVVWSESVEGATLDIHEVRDLHDRLVILAQLTGRDRLTGAEACQRFGVLNSELGADGKVHDVRFFLSWEQALEEAAGTSHS